MFASLNTGRWNSNRDRASGTAEHPLFYPARPDCFDILPTLRLINPWILPWLTYFALVVVGSLYPFTWHLPQPDALTYLWRPWQEKLTRTDVLTNVLAYLPLGLFSAKVFYRHRLNFSRWLTLTLLIASLSIALETVQLFLVGRVASNVDFTFNALGGAVGAAAAPLFSRHGRFFALWVVWRRHWFHSGWQTHAGLILLALWVYAQLSLQAPALIAGELHNSFYPFWEAASLAHFKLPASLIFALDIAGIGLFTAALLRNERPRFAAMIIVLLLAILMKILAAALLVKLSALPRLLSLEVVLGLSAGVFAVLILIYYRRGQALLQAVALTLGLLILVKLFHGAPFITASGHIPDLALRPELLLNVTGLAYLVAEAWPYLALGCTLALWERHP